MALWIMWAAGLLLAYGFVLMLIEIGKALKNSKSQTSIRKLTRAEKIFIWVGSAIFIFLLIVVPEQTRWIVSAIGTVMTILITQSLVIPTPPKPKNDTDPDSGFQPINPNSPILPNLDKILLEEQELVPLVGYRGSKLEQAKKLDILHQQFRTSNQYSSPKVNRDFKKSGVRSRKYKQLLAMLNGDTETADRLVSAYGVDRAISDLERDRRI